MRERTRLISCQGGIQLITALAAAGADVGRFQDHLIVHDLFSTPSQHGDFAQAIRLMAEHLHRWERITYLAPDRLAGLVNTDGPVAWPVALASVRDQLELETIDDLYLNRSPTRGAQLLRCCYPAAERVCYGDAIGIHFTPGYFGQIPASLGSPRYFLDLARSKASRLKQRWKPTQSFPPGWNEDRFDRYSLLLPGLFDEPAPPCRLNPPDAYMDAFTSLGSLLDRFASGTALAELPAAIAGASQVVALLTSNFTESGKMTEEAELAAYLTLAQRLRPKIGALIIVKPHPRDNSQKLARLRHLLSQVYERVLVLDDPVSFYFPFEIIFARYLAPVHCASHPVVAICVSTACLSLEVFYGVQSVVGFGEDLVRKSFRPHVVSSRLRHERDLVRAIEGIRRTRPPSLLGVSMPIC